MLEHRRQKNGEHAVNIVGELLEQAVVVDDMIDTGTKVVTAAKVLKSCGVKKVFVVVTHPVRPFLLLSVRVGSFVSFVSGSL